MAIDSDTVFSVLADPTRRKVVEMLGAGPMRAGELAERASVSPPVMSRHLRTLLESGVVEDERSPVDARVRLFFLNRDSLAALQAWLDQAQAHWAEQLGAFKRNVESRGEAHLSPEGEAARDE
ncbi:MAG TPA: metalloregulator ArsR/SmtB family transcription factor [Acidimicrobiales bacterium]|jgi:DNA-binding transcriptional ArsR family regulator|nr:metalloregulator ArsR/SmtB family transcription factor [Acidimicrobiales bacterium]